MSFYREQSVYIVGGSRGIGRATARRLVELGADVALFARGESDLEEAADAIANGGNHTKQASSANKARERVDFETLDVTDPTSVDAAFDEVAERHGPPDIVVNCAGMARPDYFEAIDEEDFDRTLQVNLYGTRHVAAEAYPYLKERDGHLVNVSSVGGYVGVFGMTDYCASKFGVIGFSEALRAEARFDGVDVSVLCPPDTETPGFERENESKPPETHAVSEGGGLADPEEVAVALLRGIERGDFLILPGLEPKVAYYASRLAPGLVRGTMDREAEEARDSRESSESDENSSENESTSKTEQESDETPWVPVLEIATGFLVGLVGLLPPLANWLLGRSYLLAVLAGVVGAGLLVNGVLEWMRPSSTAWAPALGGALATLGFLAGTASLVALSPSASGPAPLLTALYCLLVGGFLVFRR